MNSLYDYLNSVMMVISVQEAILVNSLACANRRDEVLSILFRVWDKNADFVPKFNFSSSF